MTTPNYSSSNFSNINTYIYPPVPKNIYGTNGYGLYLHDFSPVVARYVRLFKNDYVAVSEFIPLAPGQVYP
jgi:hypothetical protein